MINEVVLLGTGNLATQLGMALKNAGIRILQVYSRQANNAKELAHKLDTAYCCNTDEITSRGQLLIFAVSDTAIAPISGALASDARLRVHCSGSIDMQAVAQQHGAYGVLYPLQSFTKNREMDFSQIPIFIEASTATSQAQLNILASKLTNNTHILDSQSRRKMHLAAVFANNFANHMLNIAAELCSKENIPPSVLLPLIRETADKALDIGAHTAQTGPARRLDTASIKTHEDMLAENSLLQKIYTFVSKSISQTHKND